MRIFRRIGSGIVMLGGLLLAGLLIVGNFVLDIVGIIIGAVTR